MLPSEELRWPAGRSRRTALLLVNLGTPEAPTPAGVRRYLAEFLSDRRVVEIPRPLWWPILHGIILRVRPARSAKKYRSIWSAQGSPLKVHTERQAELLARRIASECPAQLEVAWAMRYGSPSIDGTLTRLLESDCERVLILPLYPQYAASTAASTFDAVARWASRQRNVPALRFLRDFHDHPGYIAALAASVQDHWASEGRGERLLMSFHGLPRYAVDRGDPYLRHCETTAELLANSLGLSPAQWAMAFQSRFGRARWLEPSTTDTLAQWAGSGVKDIDVICPGFVSDCLETLEEIGLEARQDFSRAGGGRLRLVPCLNERADWIEALAGLALADLRGWCDTSHEKGPAQS